MRQLLLGSPFCRWGNSLNNLPKSLVEAGSNVAQDCGLLTTTPASSVPSDLITLLLKPLRPAHQRWCKLPVQLALGCYPQPRFLVTTPPTPLHPCYCRFLWMSLFLLFSLPLRLAHAVPSARSAVPFSSPPVFLANPPPFFWSQFRVHLVQAFVGESPLEFPGHLRLLPCPPRVTAVCSHAHVM